VSALISDGKNGVFELPLENDPRRVAAEPRATRELRMNGWIAEH
jgi:hypothetical protein